jgi:hypothetical protein
MTIESTCESCGHELDSHGVLTPGGPWAYACWECKCNLPSEIHDQWWADFEKSWGIDKENDSVPDGDDGKGTEDVEGEAEGT